MKTIYQLHATTIHNNSYHKFSEFFTSISKLEKFISKNPKIVKKQITLHEINPI